MKKINMGVVLTIITLVMVIIYNVNLENERKVDKQKIEAICNEYINFECKYTMLVEKYRTMPKTISDDEYNKYLSNMKNEVKTFFVSDNEHIENQYKIIKENLDKQVIDNICVITSLTKKYLEIKQYTFLNNKAEVTFNDTVDAKYLIQLEENGQLKISEKTENRNVSDKIIFEKVNGVWKVSYASLDYITPFNGSNVMF